MLMRMVGLWVMQTRGMIRRVVVINYSQLSIVKDVFNRHVTSVEHDRWRCVNTPTIKSLTSIKALNPLIDIMTGNRERSTLTKVVYKPDSQSTEEYIVIVDEEEYDSWKKGDTSIPLARVVDSFDIFYSEQGNQGYLGRASKQQIHTVFDTTKPDEAVKKVLELGKAKRGEALPKGWNGQNDARGAHKGQISSTVHN